VTDAIRNDDLVADSKMAELREFTRTMVVSHGHPGQNDVYAIVQAGYSESHVFDIILAISVKTISNYSNHVPGLRHIRWEAGQTISPYFSLECLDTSCTGCVMNADLGRSLVEATLARDREKYFHVVPIHECRRPGGGEGAAISHIVKAISPTILHICKQLGCAFNYLRI
jgi:hypothetical protein